nr:phosphodiester glycosidase family protein [Chelatococcus reniformis]
MNLVKGLAGLGLGLLVGAAPAAAVGPCRPLAYGGADYTVCTVDLRTHALKLFWRGEDGAAFGSFDRLMRSPAGRDLVFAMNAGMYKDDRSPAGLYVEDGQQLRAANTKAGYGNFHLKPNGVFYVAGKTAGVLETGRYLAQKPRAAFATQSGPMLVIDGRIHPKFSDNGPSLKIRNGVGVANAQTVVFAISERPVSFGEFARLFRDELRCRNALFLDGSVSSLYAPGLHRMDWLMPLGPIVGAVPR